MRFPVCLEEDEYVRLLRGTYKAHHRLAFMLGFESGLRLSEIVKLQQSDINIKQKQIWIKQGKGGKDRIVPLPKHFKETLLRHIPLRCSGRALEIAFKLAAERTKLLAEKPKLHFHSLRHGFASHLIKQGMPIESVKLLMGHANISTTDIYIHLHPEDALKKYENLF